MNNFRVLIYGVAIAVSGSLVSCDNEYDLSKDINTDMKVGNYFSVPVGKTTKVELSRIIKESETILPGDNSVYEVITSGSTSSTVELTSVSVNITPSIGSYNITIPSTFSAPMTRSSNLVLNLDKLSIESDPYNVNAKLPNEVDKFFRANLSNSTTYLSLYIDSKAWPTGIDYVKLKNFTINFPQILNLVGGGNVYRQGTDIVLKSDTKKVTIEIPFNYIDIPNDSQDSYIVGNMGNKYLKLNEKLSLSADIEVSISGIPQITSVPLAFEYKAAGAVGISEVSGEFHTDANINEVITINDIPDFLKNGSSSFTPNEVNFTLSLDNPLNIAWDLSLGFMSLKDDGRKSENVEVDINARPGNNVLLISNKPGADILVEKLPMLFEFIPDKFEINSPEDIKLLSTSHEQMVGLGQSYTINAKYDVAIPFSFSKMEIEYVDDIDGLKEDLFDVLDKVDANEIYVDATVETSIPANMKASVKLFDRSGNSIDDGIKVNLDKCNIAGADNNSVKESKIEIKLSQLKDGYFKRLDRIQYTVEAANSNNNMTLRSDQYLIVKDIIAKIPNGIKLTL